MITFTIALAGALAFVPEPPAVRDVALPTPVAVPAPFRVLPYLQNPSLDGMTLVWFATEEEAAQVRLFPANREDVLADAAVAAVSVPQLNYSDLELSQRAEYPDMFPQGQYRYEHRFTDLEPDTPYRYEVTLGQARFGAEFRTAPSANARRPIRLIVTADSETEPDGRVIQRPWRTGAQHPESTGRPDGITDYLMTEAEGWIANVAQIKARQPDLLIMPGDLVQGGGYQGAWDEFFHHLAGKFDDLITRVPLLPAIGNWESFGARNGGYEPEAVQASRHKYRTYWSKEPNNRPEYQNLYYRVDYGPVTILTLDSTNGEPHGSDQDTNVNINEATYPGSDLVDLNPGSPQWEWTQAQLADAQAKGQMIFVQFHHIPYSSGGHSLPATAEGSSGQSGLPMRQYHAMFLEAGVIAVLCGHNESFERSEVGGIHYYDVGVAGDGFGIPISDLHPRRENPYREWVAHWDSAELWQGPRLVDGGKHYGHLEINLEPEGEGWRVEFVPVYIFPVQDEQGRVIRTERRIYDDVVIQRWSKP